MKKIICLGLVLIFILTALTGCMKKDNQNDSTLSSTMSKVESTIDGPSSNTQSSSDIESSSKEESITGN